ncbi:MAG TPA: hypothetical protein VMA73_01230 [Streptosporangiaceae bacterium]|nr:hypothetical protein [Streptosporangiaceae bacterium]
MAVFDAEAYLRAVGERWEPEDHEPGVLCNPVLAAAAAALVAVDAITLGRAQAIIAGYSPAPAAGRSHLISAAAAPDAAPPPPGTGRLRVVPCDRVIDQPWGRLTIRYVVFTDQATSLRVTLRPDESQPASLITFLPRARRVSVTDASGTTAVAEFSGGFRHGELDWHGHYEVRPPLAADTPWIELLGEQVQLTAEPARMRAWAEPLPAQDPAIRHLWERVATLNDFHSPHLALEATIAALTAVGAIPADGTAAGTARAAAALLRPGGPSPAGVPGGLPGPWHSLLTCWGRTGGPVATIPVGAVTPSFDGVTAAVIALDSSDEHFSISVQLVPPARTGLPYRDLPDGQHLTWWAADNLGGCYLGEQGSWDSRGGRCRGIIGFWPALDPRASSIDLMPTATTARAVIRVPLPSAGH